MNGRVKELESLCWESRQYGPDWFNSTKFAELIIFECMKVIKHNQGNSLTVSNFTDEKAQGIQLGLQFAVLDIADHFGVE